MSTQISRRALLGTGVALGAAVAVGVRAEAIPSPWKIGCYTRPWADQDVAVALDAIAEAGFKYAGMMTTNTEDHLVISANTTVERAAEVGEMCAARGLAIPSVYGGAIAVHESLEAGMVSMRRLIDNCAAAKAENLLMGGIGDEALVGTYYKAIAETCDYAQEKGVSISVKPHGGKNATGPECRKQIESVGHKNFGMWYDPGNIFYYSDGALDPVDDAETVGGLVVGMSVKDYAHPKNVELTPGTGQVDFQKVMAKLKAGGFIGGPLIVETLAPGSVKEKIAEGVKARKMVEALVAGAV